MLNDDDPLAEAEHEAAEAQRKRDGDNPHGQSPQRKEQKTEEDAAGVFSQPFLQQVLVTGRAAASGIQGTSTAAENFPQFTSLAAPTYAQAGTASHGEGKGGSKDKGKA